MQPRDIDRSFPTYNIPSGQLWWVSRAKSLGYPSNQKGACYGMSLIVMQAMLLSLEEMLIYNARLQLIANMSIQDLIKMHKYAWYSAARKKRGDALAAYDLNIFMLENREATAKQIAEEKEKIEAYREIENEFVEKNIINNSEAIQTFLAEKTALYLEIIALFDGVELAQQLPEVPLSEADHQNIFGTHKIDSQLIAVSANLTVSDELKKQGSLTEVDLIAWNKNSIELYLADLETIALEEKIDFPITFALGSSHHETCAAYYPTTNKWYFFDANYPPIQEISRESLVDILKNHAFIFEADPTIIIDVCVAGNNRLKAEALFQRFREEIEKNGHNKELNNQVEYRQKYIHALFNAIKVKHSPLAEDRFREIISIIDDSNIKIEHMQWIRALHEIKTEKNQEIWQFILEEKKLPLNVLFAENTEKWQSILADKNARNMIAHILNADNPLETIYSLLPDIAQLNNKDIFIVFNDMITLTWQKNVAALKDNPTLFPLVAKIIQTEKLFKELTHCYQNTFNEPSSLQLNTEIDLKNIYLKKENDYFYDTELEKIIEHALNTNDKETLIQIKEKIKQLAPYQSIPDKILSLLISASKEKRIIAIQFMKEVLTSTDVPSLLHQINELAQQLGNHENLVTDIIANVQFRNFLSNTHDAVDFFKEFFQKFPESDIIFSRVPSANLEIMINHTQNQWLDSSDSKNIVHFLLHHYEPTQLFFLDTAILNAFFMKYCLAQTALLFSQGKIDNQLFSDFVNFSMENQKKFLDEMRALENIKLFNIIISKLITTDSALSSNDFIESIFKIASQKNNIDALQDTSLQLMNWFNAQSKNDFDEKVRLASRYHLIKTLYEKHAHQSYPKTSTPNFDEPLLDPRKVRMIQVVSEHKKLNALCTKENLLNANPLASEAIIAICPILEESIINENESVKKILTTVLNPELNQPYCETLNWLMLRSDQLNLKSVDGIKQILQICEQAEKSEPILNALIQLENNELLETCFMNLSECYLNSSNKVNDIVDLLIKFKTNRLDKDNPVHFLLHHYELTQLFFLNTDILNAFLQEDRLTQTALLFSQGKIDEHLFYGFINFSMENQRKFLNDLKEVENPELFNIIIAKLIKTDAALCTNDFIESLFEIASQKNYADALHNISLQLVNWFNAQPKADFDEQIKLANRYHLMTALYEKHVHQPYPVTSMPNFEESLLDPRKVRMIQVVSEHKKLNALCSIEDLLSAKPLASEAIIAMCPILENCKSNEKKSVKKILKTVLDPELNQTFFETFNWLMLRSDQLNLKSVEGIKQILEISEKAATSEPILNALIQLENNELLETCFMNFSECYLNFPNKVNDIVDILIRLKINDLDPLQPLQDLVYCSNESDVEQRLHDLRQKIPTALLSSQGFLSSSKPIKSPANDATYSPPKLGSETKD